MSEPGSQQQFLTCVSAGPFQYAVAEALVLPESYFTAFRADMLYDHREEGAPFVRFAFCKQKPVLDEAAR
ncbi:N-succinyldiaminopimelate aminotransferase [Streptomyces albaduncus]|uniref:N-succinyldiaminopimelate aminotransferase n=1 Tax=Streptomyces griseoloalbus TaxID=67303 RepID=A0A7W8BVI4_9ACTN|nr:N-succinyldiaminopimelate aminotransferase [Streptomyces albaduncus]GGW81773.1 hypothetical protein GCM10010340_69790 [Streptomyces albaduncus]